MKKGDNIRLRIDGRYEAQYIKSRDENGKINYGYCYGQTYEEAQEKRDYQLQKMTKPKAMNPLILGAGMHGSDVCEIAKSLRIFNKIDFLDDDPNHKRAIGTWADAEALLEEYPVALVAVGMEETRRDWTRKLNQIGFITPTLIHPTAYVSEETEIGIGTVIYPRAKLRQVSTLVWVQLSELDQQSLETLISQTGDTLNMTRLSVTGSRRTA